MTLRYAIRRLLSLLKWTVVPSRRDELDPGHIATRRRKNTRYVIIGAVLLLVSMTVASILLQDSGVDAPISNHIAVALVLNLNVILLVVMVLLVIRNLIKLSFERREKIAGARFQTKLVLAFLAMTLIPSTLMFAVASELLGDMVDKWINTRIERNLRDSLQIAESMYRESEEDSRRKAMYLAGLVNKRGLLDPRLRAGLRRLIRQKIQEYDADLIQVYDEDYDLVAEASRPGSGVTFSMDENLDVLASVAVGETVTRIQDKREVNMVLSLAPIQLAGSPAVQPRGVVLVARESARRLIDKARSITHAFEDYKQLTLKKEIIKASYQVTLALVALVIVFSAIWIGFYLAKGITVPLRLLSEATEKVAAGDLDVRIDAPVKDDEAGHLVRAFNKMTADLKNFKEQLERANRELTESNVEMSRWGQYMEAVLQNVAGGVISIDKAGVITTINGSAAAMLGVSAEDARGKNYRKLFEAGLLAPVRRMIRDMNEMDKTTLDREVEITLNGKRVTMKLSVSVLMDQNGQYMGVVIVFDDITDILAAQRAMAWREMARVVAHEIKNPLTPIRLNAQRMRRKFEAGAADFPKVFDDATNAIIQEVDELKTLVEKFASLAKPGADPKQPEAGRGDVEFFKLDPRPSMLHDVIFEVVKLYKGTRPRVTLLTELDPSVQLVNIDSEQIKRVLVNLVENAMDAMDGEGSITIRTKWRGDERKVILEVADTGHGMAESVRKKIFLPHFSTKPNGAGLGLAIVSRVVEDHGGAIRVGENGAAGTVFTIELPVE